MTTNAEAVSAALESQGLEAIAMGDAAASEAADLWRRETVFNGAVGARPLAVVACPDEPAVVTALAVAADRGVPVAVLSGGHDMSGRALAEGNLVLDIRRQSQVRVDRPAREVTVGGGALTRDLMAALPDDLVTVTGTVSTVGVTGLSLGGGYGRLNSRFGLALDCMRRARVVLADTSVVTASASENADLFWALRGGGSGFGVVTEMTLDVHVLPEVWTATVVVPLGEARDGLRRAQALIDRHPIELSLFMAFQMMPTGDPALVLAPLWSGNPAVCATLVAGLSTAGAQVVQQGWSRYKDTFSPEIEKAWPKGRSYHLLTRTVRRIDDTAAEILCEAAGRMTSPHSAIVLHDFHGEPAGVSPEATAFPLRDSHFVIEAIGAWDPTPADEGARHMRWTEDLAANIAVLAVPGGYPNLLSSAEGERVRAFYGQAADRLRQIKTRVDPDDRFRSGTGRLDP